MTTFNCLSPSNLIFQSLQNLANFQSHHENDNIIFDNDLLSAKNWTTVDLASITKSDNTQSIKKDASKTSENKSSEEIESLRRASDSSLGSVCAPGVTTPSSASHSSDELWSTSNVNSVKTNNQQNVAGGNGIRLPVFEKISNGPF